MAISVYKTGSPTVSSTEWSLVNGSTSIATDTTTGFFTLVLDTNAIAAGDQFEVALREKVISGGTQRRMILGTLTNTSELIWMSGGFVLLEGWDLTIKKLAGTDRVIPFEIRKAG